MFQTKSENRVVMFAYLPCRFSFADFKSVFINRLRFGEKWREPKKCTLFIRGRRINTVMESTRRADSNNTCVAFALLRNFIFRCVRQKHISIRGSVCLSVCLSVRPSVRPSVCPSVCPSVPKNVRFSVPPLCVSPSPPPLFLSHFLELV